MAKQTASSSWYKTPFFLFWSSSSFIFFLWLLAYSPGIMSPDSTGQWGQAVHGIFLDTQSYLHTLYITFFARNFGTPAAVSLFQILLTSGFFAYLFSFFWKQGISKRLILLFYVLFVTSIPIGFFNITLWKDVPFSLSMVAIAFLCSKKYLEKQWNSMEVFLLVLLSIPLIFFRHNGIIYVVLLPLLLFLCFPKAKTEIAQSVKWTYTGWLLGLFAFFQWLVPPIINLAPKAIWQQNLFAFHSSVGFYAQQPPDPLSPMLPYKTLPNTDKDAFDTSYQWQPYTQITPKTAELLESVIAPEILKAKYIPANIGAVLWHEELDREIFHTQAFWDDLMKEFWTYNLPRNIHFFLGERLNMFLAATLGYGYINWSGISPNFSGLKVDPWVPGLTKAFDGGINWLYQTIEDIPWTRYLIWNNLIPILLLLGLFIHGCYQKTKRHFLIFSGLMLVQIPFLIILAPSAEWRYFYFCYLAFFITIPMYVLDKYYPKK